MKLSYEWRKIYGISAGQLVSKDLRWRIPQTNNAKISARDTALQLDLTGKELTDDGFLVFIDDLIECMSPRDCKNPQSVIRLTELCLKGNCLSVLSMMRLSEVIYLGSMTLVKLDISNNNIRVMSEFERKAWGAFLSAFRDCCVLREINFSGNRLGSAGFDVLSRIYLKSDIDFPYSNVVLDGQKTDIEKLGNLPGLPAHTLKRGLRSVPYLIFSKTCSTLLCALHIWSIVTTHDLPEYLLSYLPAGKSMTPVELEGKDIGIVYGPSEELTPLSKGFLDLGTKTRQRVDPNFITRGIEMDEESSDDDDTGPTTARELFRMKQVEMERVQKRVVIAALTTCSLQNVKLWSSTLKLLVTARAILLDKENRPEGKAQDSSDEDTEISYHTGTGALSYLLSGVCSLNIDGEYPGLQRPALASSSRDQPNLSQQASGGSGFRDCTKLQLQAPYRSAYRFGLPIHIWRDILAMAVDEEGIMGREQQIQVVRYASDWAGMAQQLRLRNTRKSEQIWQILSSTGCLVYSVKQRKK